VVEASLDSRKRGDQSTKNGDLGKSLGAGPSSFLKVKRQGSQRNMDRKETGTEFSFAQSVEKMVTRRRSSEGWSGENKKMVVEEEKKKREDDGGGKIAAADFLKQIKVSKRDKKRKH